MNVPHPTRQEFDAFLVAKANADEAFREELLRDPTGVFVRELHMNLPSGVQVKVLEETASTIYVVLPRRATEAEISVELAEESLDAIGGGHGDFQGNGVGSGGGGFRAAVADLEEEAFRAGVAGLEPVFKVAASSQTGTQFESLQRVRVPFH